MAFDYSCYSAENFVKTQLLIEKVKQDFPEIFQHMWIGPVLEPKDHMIERSVALNFPIKSWFIVSWNNKECDSAYWRKVPGVLYHVFGPGKIIVYDLDYEIVPMPDMF